MRREDFAAAVVWSLVAIAVNPAVDVYIVLANALFMRSEFHRAQWALEECLRSLPNAERTSRMACS